MTRPGTGAGGSREPDRAARLEALWSGEFGDAYTQRNLSASEGRRGFWHALLSDVTATSVLEVGSNVGGNLRWIAHEVPEATLVGLDVNVGALRRLRSAVPRAHPVLSSAHRLPFRDRRFDLVFTAGVLIHLPPEWLPRVMAEIVRCSGRYVLCAEYDAPEPTEVPYRDQRGALFKRDFGALYGGLFPELTLRASGLLGRDAGWDDVTYWLFERSR